MSGKRSSVFIGRFQPLHEGHIALIRTVLDEGKPVLVLLRPGGDNPDNPYTLAQRKLMFRKAFPTEFGKTLRVAGLPVDVGEVCFGRKVGWGIREIRLSVETEAISATKLRERAGD